MVGELDAAALKARLRQLGASLGFSQTAVAGIDLTEAEEGLRAWLHAGFHGSMAYMASYGVKRARPAELVPGTVSVVTARMDYLPRGRAADWADVELRRLQRPGEAVVSVYARGRDYHKVLRQRLQKLADALAAEVGPFGHRVFTDSAPVMEVALAERAGLGWRGKHTLLLHREAGSVFFLGEIYTTLRLPPDDPGMASVSHCGSCTACLSACPTQAIVAPYRLDARRCISYLTIEHAGPIPLELRPLMGNRIYGCDDCQLVCPWNKFAQRSALPDFDERQGLTGQQLLSLWAWTEQDFLGHTEGSAIRRIGHERWQRNLAVALGNALRCPIGSGDVSGTARLRADDAERIRAALQATKACATPLVREHIDWALATEA
jgi:epoxyqueuosine reductase